MSMLYSGKQHGSFAIGVPNSCYAERKGGSGFGLYCEYIEGPR